MPSSFDEIDHLAELLEAEVVGLSFDRNLACKLAECIAESTPEIAGTMNLVICRAGEDTFQVESDA